MTSEVGDVHDWEGELQCVTSQFLPPMFFFLTDAVEVIFVTLLPAWRARGNRQTEKTHGVWEHTYPEDVCEIVVTITVSYLMLGKR